MFGKSSQRLFPQHAPFQLLPRRRQPPSPPRRIKRTPYLFDLIYLFLPFIRRKKRHLRYLWLITCSQPSLWLIFLTEMSSLGRYKWHEKTHAAVKGRGERESRGGKRQGKVCLLFDTCKLLSTWHFQSTVQSGGRARGYTTEPDTERLYNYNAQLIKEKEYNRIQMNLGV